MANWEQQLGSNTYTMFEKLKKKYLRLKAKRTLTKRYEYLMEVDSLLEEHITDKILQGGDENYLSKGRQDLANKQAEMRMNEAFLTFLKKTK